MTLRTGALLLLVGTLWGLNWPAVRILLDALEPITLRALAFPTAAAVLAVLCALRGTRLLPDAGDMVRIAGVSFFLIFGFNVLVTFGQLMVETSQAAIIAYTMPAMTAVLAVPVLGERLSWRVLAALAVGMTGIAVLAAGDPAALIAAPAGTCVMLAAALSWAIGNVGVKRVDWRTPMMTRAVWFFAAATLYTAPLALIFEAPLTRLGDPAAHAPLTLAVFAFHVLGPMVICYVLWTTLLAKLPATIAAVSMLTAPVVGVVSSLAVLGEPLTPAKGVALALIIASIMVSLKPQQRVATA
ncbi:MAG: DMT family transporter [Pseudomonadota bacterium]